MKNMLPFILFLLTTILLKPSQPEPTTPWYERFINFALSSSDDEPVTPFVRPKYKKITEEQMDQISFLKKEIDTIIIYSHFTQWQKFSAEKNAGKFIFIGKEN